MPADITYGSLGGKIRLVETQGGLPHSSPRLQTASGPRLGYSPSPQQCPAVHAGPWQVLKGVGLDAAAL